MNADGSVQYSPGATITHPGPGHYVATFGGGTFNGAGTLPMTNFTIVGNANIVSLFINMLGDGSYTFDVTFSSDILFGYTVIQP